MTFGRLAVCKSLVPIVLALTATAAAYAHDSRPVYVEVAELSSNTYSLAWKVPPTVQWNNIPTVLVGNQCSPKVATTLSSLRGQAVYQCESSSTGPGSIVIRYPRSNPALSTVVKVTYQGQQPLILHAAPEDVEIELRAAQTSASAFSGYGMLGVSHILRGYDHLLFVVLLVVLAGTPKRIIYAITGFTLAHSLTLVLSSLQIIALPIVPVEAVIALSIAWLAAELARGRSDSLTYTHPQLVAALFGLLHGLGFAAVLRDIGLPSSEVLVALLAFNLGVEVGQLLFVAGVLVVFKALTVWRPAPQMAAQPIVTFLLVYPAGVLAMFWVFDRLRFVVSS